MPNTPDRGHINQHVIIEADHFERAIGMVSEQLDRLREELHAAREGQAQAMAQAMRYVLTDKETLTQSMQIVVEVAQRRAAEKTGYAVGGFIRSKLLSWIVAGCIFVMVAKAAGIDLAGKVWAAIREL